MAEVPVKDKIEFTLALVSDFAKKYSLSTTQAFNYLERFNAITLLEQHYNIAHTLAYSEMVYKKSIKNVHLWRNKNVQLFG